MSRARFASAAAPLVHIAVPLLFLLAAGWSDPARGATIDFEDLAHGQVVNGLYADLGVTLSVVNLGSGPDLGVAFDSTTPRVGFMDIIDPTQMNYAGPIGNIAVIQRNDVGCGDGICDLPDDDHGHPAGWFQLEFDAPVLSFGFDLIDIEDTTHEPGFVQFWLAGGDTVTLSFDELACDSGPFCDPSIVFGNDLANRISPISSEALGGSIEKVRIGLGGSGGVDALTFMTPAEVPEPAGGLLLLAALAALSLMRRRP